MDSFFQKLEYHHHQAPIANNDDWSCFRTNDLLVDLLDLPQRAMTEATSISSTLAMLDQDDTIHQFGVLNHVFALIRHQGAIAYCDYWKEARPDYPFRIVPITLAGAKGLIRSYLMEDLDQFLQFSTSDASFIADYQQDYHEYSDLFRLTMDHVSWTIEQDAWTIGSQKLDQQSVDPR